MKTRRKNTKTPVKGRRCVIKSPMKNIRKNILRNVKNLASTTKLSVYESPLKHLRHNGPAPVKSPIKTEVPSKSPVKTETPLRSPVKIETTTKSIARPQVSSKTPVKTEQVLEQIPHTSITNGEGKRILRPGLMQKNVKKLEQETHDFINISEEVNSTNDSIDSIVDTSQLIMHENSTEISASSSKKKKRSIHQLIGSGKVPVSKRKKLKKSPLSKFNETHDSNILSDSIIIVEDSETESICNQSTKSENSIQSLKSEIGDQFLNSETSNKSFKSEISNKSSKSEPDNKTEHINAQTINSTKSNNDIVVIDCNDTSVFEMESYHNAFIQDEQHHSPPPDNLLDSVIVIEDQEDDGLPGCDFRNPFPKPMDGSPANPTEDCFVVWSSHPQPSTSTSNETHLPQNNSWMTNKIGILSSDKILLDTGADNSNLRFLNNENSKPTKKKLTKSPKVTKNTFKKPLTKTSLIKSKTAVKPVTKVTKTTVTKTTTTTSSTTKKNTKNDGELIFAGPKEGTSTTKTNSKKGKLREIVIDGSNVGMAFTNNKMFSEKGIKLLIDYFTKKGHTVRVFVPQHKRSRNHPLLEKWYDEGIVVFTPSRKLGNKSFTPYDDRYILEYATACNGIVVSQDQFRDLYAEKTQYRDTIENRLLVPTFVGDYVMFPEDPLGRNGPNLAAFLRH